MFCSAKIAIRSIINSEVIECLRLPKAYNQLASNIQVLVQFIFSDYFGLRFSCKYKNLLTFR